MRIFLRKFFILAALIGTLSPSFSDESLSNPVNHTPDPVEDLLKESTGYLDGAHGYKLDKDNGVKIAKFLAVSLDARALTHLANLYFSGDGVEQDQALSVIFYKMAAEQGYGPAQFHLGIIFKNGHGVEQSYPASFYYLALAAQNKKDLKEMCEDAAFYRDLVYSHLTKQEKNDVFIRLNAVLN